MKEPTLVILAAGLGSRYGGLKQIDTVGTNGESIIDFSIFDACQAGFKKLILIIRKEHEELFEENIVENIRPFMEVSYAYQNVHDLPEGFSCPFERYKPWGTVHALLSATSLIDGPFMIINADDYYGQNAFKIMYNFLTNAVSTNKYGMVGYQLTNTLTDFGPVSRAICQKDDNDNLSKIEEKRGVFRKNSLPYFIDENGIETLLNDGLVSMNLWGFTEDILPLLQQQFVQFLHQSINVDSSELVLSTAISNIISSNDVTIKVLPTDDQWFGISYPQDKEKVKAMLALYKEKDLYPFDLWD